MADVEVVQDTMAAKAEATWDRLHTDGAELVPIFVPNGADEAARRKRRLSVGQKEAKIAADMRRKSTLLMRECQ